MKNHEQTANNRVLVVGAGAVGLATAYPISLAGAETTLLVRKGNKERYRSPLRLYCYDDAKLKTYDGFGVSDRADELAQTSFRFIIVTLDATASRSAEGEELLRKLGEQVRASEAVVVMCAAGADMHAFYLETMQIPGDRLLRGLFGMLSHQAAAALPVHSPADPALIEQAVICYKHPDSKQGFRIETRNRKAAQTFVELYDRCGV